MESKLVKLFGEQLLVLRRKRQSGGPACPPHCCAVCSNYPCQRTWLEAVGLRTSSVKWVCERSPSLEWLLSLDTRCLSDFLRPMDDLAGLCLLTRALFNLSTFIEATSMPDCDARVSRLSLHWDSWQSPTTLRKSLTSTVHSSVAIQDSGGQMMDRSPSTPSSSGDGSAPYMSQILSAQPSDNFFSRAARARKNTAFPRLSSSAASNSGYSEPLDSTAELSASPDDSGDGVGSASASHSPAGGAPNTPRSPRTPTLPGSMSHVINHVFVKMFKVATCDYCKRQIIYGVRCRECRYKCHRHCERLVPPSCGLPRKFVDFFIDQVQSQGGASSPRARLTGHRKRSPAAAGVQAFLGDSSSTTSSCSSTAPSSPAFPCSAGTPASITSCSSSTATDRFHFPDVAHLSAPPPLHVPELWSVRGGTGGAEVSVSSNTDSERTLSQGRVDSLDSCGSELHGGVSRQDSLSLREWDIPFEEVGLGEVIGRGRMGTVHRGHWHGEVAVKLIDMHDDSTLFRFKQDVATFRKTRHENLVLFMGACVCPPRLAIITSYCRGNTLHTLLHVHQEKFNLTRVCTIARHISLGMGYLHARNIIHKDLKSNNVFVDGNSVVITDFGLLFLAPSAQTPGRQSGLEIPRGWLCYLAPEVIRRLSPGDNSHLPFSAASDVFAFGTLWYELLSGEWPWQSEPVESVIFRSGLGMKPSLGNIRASKQVKDVLMKCWCYDSSNRPNFVDMLSIIDKIAKKRLIRSPSHPVHLSRSVESVF